MATGVVHGVVVPQAGVGQFDRSAQLFCGAQDILQVAGDLFTASHRRPQAHHVDVGYHAAGGGHHNFMAGATECAVGGGELLGPIPGRVSGAIFERPVTRAGHHEENLGHDKLTSVAVVRP